MSRGPKKGVKAKAIYNYTAQNDDELSLKCGDVINVMKMDMPDDGWWLGEISGRVGVFPDNFVQVVSESDEEIFFTSDEAQSKQKAAAMVDIVLGHNLDSVQTDSDKLVHITVNRVKGPQRRPPSNIQIKMNGTSSNDNIDDNDCRSGNIIRNKSAGSGGGGGGRGMVINRSRVDVETRVGNKSLLKSKNGSAGNVCDDGSDNTGPHDKPHHVYRQQMDNFFYKDEHQQQQQQQHHHQQQQQQHQQQQQQQQHHQQQQQHHQQQQHQQLHQQQKPHQEPKQAYKMMDHTKTDPDGFIKKSPSELDSCWGSSQVYESEEYLIDQIPMHQPLPSLPSHDKVLKSSSDLNNDNDGFGFNNKLEHRGGGAVNNNLKLGGRLLGPQNQQHAKNRQGSFHNVIGPDGDEEDEDDGCIVQQKQQPPVSADRFLMMPLKQNNSQQQHQQQLFNKPMNGVLTKDPTPKNVGSSKMNPVNLSIEDYQVLVNEVEALKNDLKDQVQTNERMVQTLRNFLYEERKNIKVLSIDLDNLKDLIVTQISFL